MVWRSCMGAVECVWGSSDDLSASHCRNCGNVFCASCCDQKIPVPSQQLFEPSRVCKTCYSSLQLGPAPLDLELDKPITASSNWAAEEQNWYTAEEEHKSFTECPPELHVCICCRFLCTDGGWREAGAEWRVGMILWPMYAWQETGALATYGGGGLLSQAWAERMDILVVWSRQAGREGCWWSLWVFGLFNHPPLAHHLLPIQNCQQLIISSPKLLKFFLKCQVCESRRDR